MSRESLLPVNRLFRVCFCYKMTMLQSSIACIFYVMTECVFYVISLVCSFVTLLNIIYLLTYKNLDKQNCRWIAACLK